MMVLTHISWWWLTLSIFSCAVGHSQVFFGNHLFGFWIQNPFPIFNCFIYLFRLLSCMSSWYALYINHLLDTWFTNIFSHSIAAFSFWGFPLLCRTFLVWCGPTYLFLLLLPLLLVSNPENDSQDRCQGAYLLCFLLRVLWFQVLHLHFN